VHVALLSTAVALSRFVISQTDELDWSRFRVEPLRLHESTPIFFVPDSDRAPVRAALSLAPHGAGKSGPTVLEPNYRPEAKLPKSVPPLAHWSRMAPPEWPKPAASSIITPGRAEAPSPEPQLTAPPSLSVPTREVTAGAVNNSATAASAAPRTEVPVANTSTMPIKTADSGPARAASFDLSAGQPVNVLALSEDRSRQRFVEIERGLQNVSGSGAAEGGGTSRGEVVRADGNSTTRAGIPASTAQTDSRFASSNPDLELVKPSSSGVRSRALAQSELKRVNHPANGSYDVVVTQAASVHDSAARGSSATGTVYTVYLAVGDDKEWVLEFRGAASPRQPQSTLQIMVGDDSSITPPYPILTVIPDKLPAALGTKLVLDGSITAAGRLRNVQLAGPASVLSERILELLEEWRFRPALQNGLAVEVDVRLIVPPRS
jgi:hypothetical protein